MNSLPKKINKFIYILVSYVSFNPGIETTLEVTNSYRFGNCWQKSTWTEKIQLYKHVLNSSKTLHKSIY
jgi:hypothetical protein